MRDENAAVTHNRCRQGSGGLARKKNPKQCTRLGRRQGCRGMGHPGVSIRITCVSVEYQYEFD